MTSHNGEERRAQPHRLVAEVATIASADEWNTLIARAPFPHSTQAFAYGEGKASTNWKVARIRIAVEGETVAICQILERRIAGLRVASRINRGPIFLQDTPQPAVIDAVFGVLKRRWGQFPKGMLIIAPALEQTSENEAILRALHYRRRNSESWTSARVDLRPDEDAILSGFSSSFRNKIRKGAKARLTVEISNEIDTVDWLAERQREQMERLKLSYSGDDFYRHLALSGGDDFAVLRAIKDGEPVGGLALVKAGRTAEYNVGWYGPQARDLAASNFLLWEAMKEMKRRGAETLDVGGLLASDEGFSQFKRGMNGSEYTLIGEWYKF